MKFKKLRYFFLNKGMGTYGIQLCFGVTFAFRKSLKFENLGKRKNVFLFGPAYLSFPYLLTNYITYS